jgi:outer membrane protein assembly factor BamB
MDRRRVSVWFAVSVLLCGGAWLSAQPGGPGVPDKPGGPEKPRVRGVPGPVVLKGQLGQAHQPVYVEDSPAASDLLDEAHDLRDRGRFADAVQKLQRVIDEYPHKLMPAGDGTYTDALLWVRRELLEDDRLLAAYRSSFGPAAERAVGLAMPSARSPIDAEALRDVVSRYNVTPAGLDAGFALAAYHLERAEGRDASGVLDELADHPDLPAHAGRYHYLRAVAGYLLADTAAYQEHRRALQKSADRARLAQLDALVNRTHPPLRLTHDPAGQAPTPSTLPRSLDEPLWEVELTDRQSLSPNQRPGLRAVPVGQPVTRVIPVGDVSRVYVNLGDRVTAYDLASGGRLWEVTDLGSDSDLSAQMLVRGRQPVTEPRGVWATGDRAYALLGWSNPRQVVRPGLGGVVSLVGIDARDGRVLWRVRPGELDKSLAKASFAGTPLGAGGRVFTLVKRVQVSGLHDLYITSVNGADGTLLWRRHISSSSTQGGYNTGPSARMVLHAGRIYICDNRGTVASVDGRTGTVRWIAFLPDAGLATPAVRRGVLPFKDVPEPVLVRAGLLVPSATVGGSHVLLDKQTGRQLRVLNTGDWATANACYAAGGDVLAVGHGVTLFDGSTLERRWRTPLDAGVFGLVRGRPAVDTAMTPAGSPGSPGNSGLAVLSTDRRLVALSLGDGEIVADQPLSAPGNVLLAPGQVVIATATGLAGYTDWPVAHRQLLAKARQAPGDPQPGLALARLALRVGRDQAVLEGVDLALASLQARTADPSAAGGGGAFQGEVFARLRALADPSGGAGRSLRGDLLDRMATAAQTPRQEVAYQLARGLYLEELGEPRRAAEHYQAVLADRSLAAELYTVSTGSRRAGLEARRLLAALIQAHGREVYQPFDLLAEHELSELLRQGERDPRRYIALADRYPLAVSSDQARLHAADMLTAQGEPDAAMRQLQAVYLNTDSPDLWSHTAGRIVQMYLDSDRLALAHRWLRRVQREHPGLTLTRGDQPVSPSAWGSELSFLLSSARPLPRITLPLAGPRLIEGWPMPAPAGGDSPPPRDRVLMRVGQKMRMLTGPKLDQAWEKPLPAPDARVLSLEGRQLIWWSSKQGLLGAVDSRTGEPLWPDVDVTAALDQAGDPRRRLKQRTQEQMRFVRFLGGPGARNLRGNPAALADTVVTAVDLTAVSLADRLGRVVCIDRQTGQVRWRMLSPADHLTAMSIGDGLLAIGGASWADTQAQSGVVILLDTLTGEQLGTTLETDDVPTSLGFADNGLLIAVSVGRAVAYEPATGRTRWRRELGRASAARRVWVGGRVLIVATAQGQVESGSALVLDADDGQVVNRLAIRSAAGRARSFQAFQADGDWQVMSPTRASALSASGRTRWADAICAPIGHILMQLIGERYVCIVGRSGAQQVPVLPGLNVGGRPELEQAIRKAIAAGRLRIEAGSYRLYLLDRLTGAIVSDTPLDGMPGPIDPASSVFIDGALLFGVGDQTLVVTAELPGETGASGVPGDSGGSGD